MTTIDTQQSRLISSEPPVFTCKGRIVWCELRLPVARFTRSWVCCPGETEGLALRNAMNQAQRLRRVST